MSSSSMRVLAPDVIAQAAAELIFALQREFPQARLIPCEAIEGEAIHLEVRLPGRSAAELSAAVQERALDLKQAIEDRYGLYALVRVVPETDT
jgi:hypothetical protein